MLWGDSTDHWTAQFSLSVSQVRLDLQSSWITYQTGAMWRHVCHSGTRLWDSKKKKILFQMFLNCISLCCVCVVVFIRVAFETTCDKQHIVSRWEEIYVLQHASGWVTKMEIFAVVLELVFHSIFILMSFWVGGLLFFCRLEFMATVGIHWVEVLAFVRLQNSYMHFKISLEAEWSWLNVL